MEIGKKIKQKRTELGITQEVLAERLNVARSTISNWEIGRNYPDIQTIVLLSDELDISLDELLKGDKVVVKKIANDTKARKKNKVLITILSATVVTLVILFIWVASGRPGGLKMISELDEIELVSLEKESDKYILTVKPVELPAYRRLSLFSLDGVSENTINLRLGTDVDLLLRNEEPLEIIMDNSFVEEADTLNITDDQGKVLKTIDLN